MQKIHPHMNKITFKSVIQAPDKFECSKDQVFLIYVWDIQAYLLTFLFLFF